MPELLFREPVGGMPPEDRYRIDDLNRFIGMATGLWTPDTLSNYVTPGFTGYTAEVPDRPIIECDHDLVAYRRTFDRPTHPVLIRGNVLLIPRSQLPIFPGTGEPCDVGAMIEWTMHMPPGDWEGVPEEGRVPVAVRIVESVVLDRDRGSRLVAGRTIQAVGRTGLVAPPATQAEFVIEQLRYTHEHPGDRLPDIVPIEQIYEATYGLPMQPVYSWPEQAWRGSEA